MHPPYPITPSPQTTTAPNTRSTAKTTFTHITDVLIDKANITKAFKEDGIENVADILRLTDKEVDDLTYLDTDPSITTAYSLKKGEKGLIRSFIHLFTIKRKLVTQLKMIG
jgi:hypothetical protein